MKEFSLGYIANNKSDFKVCKSCNAWNWYENEECHACFKEEFRKMKKEDINREYNFWTKREEYSTAGARDGVLKTV